ALDARHIDGDADSRLAARDADHAVGVHGPLRYHDVLLPVPRARTEVTREAEVGERRQRDVICAADTALQHTAAPHGNPVALADVVIRLCDGDSYHSRRLDL